MPLHKKKTQSGFTLLEVILSIALLTTIVMLTINILASEMSLRQKIIDRYPFEKITNRIAQDISGAFVLSNVPTDNQINFIYTKENSGLLFTVMNHVSLIADTKESNLARIGYLIERNENKNQLIRIVDTQMEDGKYIPNSGVGVRTVLVDDVKDFILTFWKQNDFTDSWNSTTNEQGKLPQMVKISLTLYPPLNASPQNKKKQELHLEEIVYIRNAKYQPGAGDVIPEEYPWQ